MSEICKTCRFYVDRECRRFPPVRWDQEHRDIYGEATTTYPVWAGLMSTTRAGVASMKGMLVMTEWLTDALLVLVFALLYFGSWGMAFRDVQRRWPKGWEWIPH